MEDEVEPLENYFLLVHKASMLEILLDPDIKKHYSININFAELFENDTKLGNKVLKEPQEALEELDEWILYIQDLLIDDANDASEYTAKTTIHARVYGLPPCPELHRTVFPKNEDVDLFLQITGTVIRVTGTKMLEYQRDYRCTKCKYTEKVEAVYEQKYMISVPRKCGNPEKCAGSNFIAVGDLSAENCKDYQEIKIQEQSSKLNVGMMPSWMWVTLEDDLVDVCKPGDDVTICGTVKCRWGALIPGKRIDVSLALQANHIQVNNEQIFSNIVTPEIRNQFVSFWEKYQYCPLVGRDLILKSFCPKLYGMYLVKLAVAMVLAGGSRCKEGNDVGIQIRSEPHILLVGDPGTGKSQLLRYAAKVIPRSILTTGVGTTSAGLTVAAVMEDGQWQLEGGALVLADGGICCIDEFNSMKPHDRTSIHEAMEQQTISVAKASIVCKLSTRCSILAATNPKGGHLDPEQPLSLNLALPSPLLSRFDLILMLKDRHDKEWDNLVADYILSGKNRSSVKNNSSLWNLETLQQYFSVIKKINPTLTPSTNKILGAYYQAQRNAMLRNKARTTVRLLDSLVRLSQAHAKLMFHTEVQIMDSIFAILLIESSMQGECSVLTLDSLDLQTTFNDNPMQNYSELVVSVLNQLNLHEILNVEFISLRNKYRCTPNEETITSQHFDNSVHEKPGVENEITGVEVESDNKLADMTIKKSPESSVSCSNSLSDVPVESSSNYNTGGTNETFSFKNDEVDVINAIPSANDGFDLSILNYTGNETQEDLVTNKVNQKIIPTNEVAKTSLPKVNLIREKLMKFRKSPDRPSSKLPEETSTIPVEENINKSQSCIPTSANDAQVSCFSQSMFESNSDIDDLDLDF